MQDMPKNISHKPREAVQVVLLNEEGQVLAVSRKDNHSDMGLPGGKRDPEDSSLEDALKREVKEETGLGIQNLLLVYVKHKSGYLGYTYLADYSGEINYDREKEPHVVRWTDFSEVEAGSFGWWNTQVAESLESLGVEFKRRKMPLKPAPKKSKPTPPLPPPPRILRIPGFFEGWAFWKKKK